MPAVALDVSSEALFSLVKDAHTIKQTDFLQSSLCNWSSSDDEGKGGCVVGA